MEIDLDTFLTALYMVVDDVYRTQFAAAKPSRPGVKPTMSDSEVLTVAVLAQWQQNRSERGFVAYVTQHWRRYFPTMLSQSAFNRRVRDLASVLGQLGPTAIRQIAPVLLVSAYEVLDGVPVPLMRRQRGRRHRLFGAEAGIGCGGTDRDWYYGVELVTAVTASGIITGFVLSPANTEERWAVDALLRWRDNPFAAVPTALPLASVLGPAHRRRGNRLGPTGPISGCLSAGQAVGEGYLADEGERGDAWVRHWFDDYGAAVLTPSAFTQGFPADQQRAADRYIHGLRQVIETVNGVLTAVFGLKFPRARTFWGLRARLGAKVAALDLAVGLNHLFARPTFVIFNPLG